MSKKRKGIKKQIREDTKRTIERIHREETARRLCRETPGLSEVLREIEWKP